MMRLACTIALCVGGGCGGGGGGGGDDDPGEVTGTLGGNAFPIMDAISASVAQTQFGQTSHAAYIWMSDSPDICGDITSNRQRPSSKRLLLEVVMGSGSTITAPTGPGMFPVDSSDPSKGATVAASDFDASCQTIDAGTANATGGTVVLTTVSGDVFAGTFDVTFDSGDHLTGSFDPAGCPDLAMVFSPLYGTHCM
jgi:hypothetical protein